MSTELPMIYRLAFRGEGEHIVCYFAAPDSMDGAMVLSSMRRSLLRSVPELWDAWRELMREVANVANVEVLGVEAVSWEEYPAPPHEKAGRG